jgi:hypothetical protein
MLTVILSLCLGVMPALVLWRLGVAERAMQAAIRSDKALNDERMRVIAGSLELGRAQEARRAAEEQLKAAYERARRAEGEVATLRAELAELESLRQANATHTPTQEGGAQ